ncbi:KaiC/GvpD/RAD55 family RecA-like ATPase [Methanocalculus alkaliphilus]|uniref:RAD55 family ATPase n=1 Tax=Methanocalculus alkaliphilus TaxID=768730 RepID=UPI00209D2466|nr:ATPase domain-containing protein [Methanocalculus alkaliphilus]MCP1714451.1 KaiC/GvpD/RAD55 family RecA-like ATPase [Methanocalculus alkaliphilus]
MFEDTVSRMPTGIASLDPVLNGGVIPGSLVLLLSDIGAGSAEFAYTSLITHSRMGSTPSSGYAVPEEIRYISITRTKEDIIREITSSFKRDITTGITDRVLFSDLSGGYFDRSIVPATWYDSQEGIVARMQRRKAETDSLLSDLIAELGAGKKNSLVVIDSLTDLAGLHNEPVRWKNLVAFLHGLQRVAKAWNTTIFLHLARGIVDPSRELEICDAADAVILFQWEESSAQRRQRIMYFLKFRGVMPYLEERDLVKFAVKISDATGFEVANIRMVI